MAKYHLNPETGNPGVCNAKKQCRFGEKTLHFATKEAAQAAFELSMEGEALEGKRRANKVAKAAKAAAINTNLDPIPFEDYDELYQRMSEQESNEVWNRDTIVRDWYYDARASGLNHRAALTFADDWDDYSNAKMDEDYEGFAWESEFSTLLNKYVSGEKKG